MATVIAFIAHSDRPGGNVYLAGESCWECDPHLDPMQRRGVPCRQAFEHALCRVHNWRLAGDRAAQVSIVRVVDTGDVVGMVAEARAQLAARSATKTG